MAHDVFISHSSKDKAVAAAICSALENAQIRCWVAPRDIPPASEWASSIVDALKTARVMILVFSEHSNDSTHVRKELTVAADAGVVIVPLKIDDTPLGGLMEYYLSDTHWLDAMNPPTERQIAQLLDTVRPIVQAKGGGAVGLGRPPEPTPEPTAEPASGAPAQPDATSAAGRSRPKMAWVAALAVALAIVAIAIGVWALVRPGGDGKANGAQELATVEEGKLTVGMDANYPPFEFLDSGKLMGFDVEIMNAIGDRLDLEVDYKMMRFDDLISALQDGECDILASAMTITQEREYMGVTFSEPYFTNDQAFVVPADSEINGVVMLKPGDSIAVISGQVGENTAQEQAPSGVAIQRYGDQYACTDAVASGAADTCFLDLPIANLLINPSTLYYLDSGTRLRVVEEYYTGEQYGFAMREADTALIEAVNAALAEVKDDGTYLEIYSIWFEGEPSAMP